MELYRPCPDLLAPRHLADTAEMTEAQSSIARRERQAARLERLAEIGMALAEALATQVAESPAADLARAYAKISQAVRWTITLEARVAEGLLAEKTRLAGERAERRAEAETDCRNAKETAILEAVDDAIFEKYPAGEGEAPEAEEAREALNLDLCRLLDETLEFEDYLDRPVGETVAKLCKALGLDPDWAVERDGAWMIKRYRYVPELCRWARPALEAADPAPA